MARYDTLRWGILGTGRIAGEFVQDLSFLPDHVVTAVGSRTEASARAFAARHSVPRAHSSYETLVADPEVDIVYVSSPHPGHRPHTELALNAGKPVLVEKPFALTGAEARSMVDCARDRGLFLMEAMWMRFLPHIRAVREVLAQGTIGTLVSFHADHGWFIDPVATNRHYSPELGGGALLDLGIYPVSLATLLLGAPEKVHAAATPTFTGVDANTSVILEYASGVHATFTTSILATLTNRAVIIGSAGRIEIDSIFYAPTAFTVYDRDGKVVLHRPKDYPGHGLREEAAEAARCLRAGHQQSPLMSWDESVAIMDLLDTIRDRSGVPR